MAAKAPTPLQALTALRAAKAQMITPIHKAKLDIIPADRACALWAGTVRASRIIVSTAQP